MKNNEKSLKGQELVEFLMTRFGMTEDEALNSLAENIGNVVKEQEKREMRMLEELFTINLNQDMLDTEKYPRKFQLTCWAAYYNVYKFIVNNGELLALDTYPAPIVKYFSNWIKKNN